MRGVMLVSDVWLWEALSVVVAVEISGSLAVNFKDWTIASLAPFGFRLSSLIFSPRTDRGPPGTTHTAFCHSSPFSPF